MNQNRHGKGAKVAGQKTGGQFKPHQRKPSVMNPRPSTKLHYSQEIMMDDVHLMLQFSGITEKVGRQERERIIEITKERYLASVKDPAMTEEEEYARILAETTLEMTAHHCD